MCPEKPLALMTRVPDGGHELVASGPNLEALARRDEAGRIRSFTADMQADVTHPLTIFLDGSARFAEQTSLGPDGATFRTSLGRCEPHPGDAAP